MKNALIYIFLLLGLGTYSFWLYDSDEVFYIGISLTSITASVYMLLTAQGFAKRIAFVAVATCISTLMDELFFSPTVFAWNDYILLPLAFFGTYLKSYNHLFKKEWQRNQEQGSKRN